MELDDVGVLKFVHDIDFLDGRLQVIFNGDNLDSHCLAGLLVHGLEHLPIRPISQFFNKLINS